MSKEEPNNEVKSFVDEMKSFISFTEEEESQILTINPSNKEFKRIVKDWSNGVYDEDPEYVKDHLLALVD